MDNRQGQKANLFSKAVSKLTVLPPPFQHLKNATIFFSLSFPMQLENYIQDSMKKEMVEIQQTAVQNQTAVMIEIGTNLLNQTAEQTRKLTDVEAQVSKLFQPKNASASQIPIITLNTVQCYNLQFSN